MTTKKSSSPNRPTPVHVQFDPKTNKYVLSYRMPGEELRTYDTLQEALAAAESIERVKST